MQLPETSPAAWAQDLHAAPWLPPVDYQLLWCSLCGHLAAWQPLAKDGVLTRDTSTTEWRPPGQPPGQSAAYKAQALDSSASRAVYANNPLALAT